MGSTSPGRNMTLNVNFTSTPSIFDAPVAGSKLFDPLAHVRGQLDPALVKAMNDSRPALMAWLRASEANVVLFTTDPMSALKKALPNFDPAMLARIATMRAQSQQASPTSPGVTISKFTASVAPEVVVK